MKLKERDKNCVFKMISELMDKFKDMNYEWINEIDPKHALELTSDIVRNHFSSLNSTHKRNKTFFASDQFVAPIERAIGTRWELKKKVDSRGQIIRIPRLIQCTLQYVPILDTLKALFACQEFSSMYFKHNGSIKPTENGRDGSKLYTCFSSGISFAKCELFKLHRDCLQLQISADDWEPCSALQSKANRHKICSVYFSIHNMPAKYQSKLQNVYLICLANSDDIKTKQTDFNNIWKMIVDEIKVLETEGIDLENGKNIKGTLVQTAFDNLEANTSLGFAGSFASHKYCRHCLSSKEECHRFTRESECVVRTIENYDQSLDIVAESESINLFETDGVKFYCVLSDLEYYHIIENPTVDIMHDINEGCIPELMKEFCKYCFKEKIFTFVHLDNLTKSFDYGILNSANIPSEISSLAKNNLKQNASQSMCLFMHIPFILYDYKDHSKLKDAWKSIETLLQICEIVWSYGITEINIQHLESKVTHHLDLFKAVFNKHFFICLMIVHQFSFQQIMHIISIASNQYFICQRYRIKRFDTFLNSFEVENNSDQNPILIKFNDLLHFKSYELKILKESEYIISDSLDLRTHLNE